MHHRPCWKLWTDLLLILLLRLRLRLRLWLHLRLQLWLQLWLLLLLLLLLLLTTYYYYYYLLNTPSKLDTLSFCWLAKYLFRNCYLDNEVWSAQKHKEHIYIDASTKCSIIHLVWATSMLQVIYGTFKKFKAQSVRHMYIAITQSKYTGYSLAGMCTSRLYQSGWMWIVYGSVQCLLYCTTNSILIM